MDSAPQGQRWPSKTDGMGEQRRTYALPAKSRKEKARLVLLGTPSKPANQIKSSLPWRDGSEEIERTWNTKQGEFTPSGGNHHRRKRNAQCP